MINLNFVGVVILFTIISSCTPEPEWDPMTINTFTSRRIMDGAAKCIGLSLVQELYAYKKRNRALYLVTFEGKRQSGVIYECTAKVHEFVPFTPKVLWFRCKPPTY
ncbi:uncharacterized protein LOC123538844 isoform X1 [Mercenaria mercenaria]|uniref:uncharacterized protein LOC123538844 isoform X1 n=1 Tax=Mercenaria mercenaria TaxID=6596 RepID=UPI00234F0ED7|nr:uncharacterized protein LOC123538844 isoform X1 [Mercenaria mercenaria]